MSLVSIPADVARETARQNESSIWYRPRWKTGPLEKNYAGVRLREKEFFTPKVKSTVTIRNEDEIFTIGSCFARNIEAQLIRRNKIPLSHTEAFDKYQRNPASSIGAERNYWSKFNTFSILQQLEWSLEKTSYPLDALVRLPEDTWVDPHAHTCLQFSTLEDTIERRTIMDALFRRVIQCRILIITLGLNEVWRDKQTGLMMNFTPTSEMLNEHQNRFEFTIPTLEENLNALDRVHEMLSKVLPKDNLIVVTVSPVTLAATFTDHDVVLANWRSKCTLLSAAHHWSHSHDNVYYFPSFEMTYHSNPASAWQEDRRHPSDKMVEHIVDVFMSHFVSSVN